MNYLDDLNIVDAVHEALLESGFRPCALRDSAVECLMPVHFDTVKRTRLGRFLILALTDQRTAASFYKFAVEHPWLLRFLSKRLGKSTRIIEEHDGRVNLIITLVPSNLSAEQLSPISGLGQRTATRMSRLRCPLESEVRNDAICLEETRSEKTSTPSTPSQ